MSHPVSHPVSFEVATSYFARELPLADEQELEAHAMGCATCHARLAEVAEVVELVGLAVRSGNVLPLLSEATLARLRKSGLTIEEASIRNGAIDAVFPAHADLLIGRFPNSLGVGRVHLEFRGEHGGGTVEDVVVDASSDLLVCCTRQHFGGKPGRYDTRLRFFDAAVPERLLAEWKLSLTLEPRS